MDKAGKDYWNKTWSEETLPVAVNPEDSCVNNYINRKFHDYFCQVFKEIDTNRAELLEVGCAKSAWLPYFNKTFDFSVTGIDYSFAGCSMAEAVLKKSKVEGVIVCSDFFSPPSEMIGAFDVVVSFGVAEHFENTAECLSAFAKFLKPGGMLITNIPNMRGLPGFLQMLLNKPVYDIHVPLDRNELQRAHERAGLEIVRSENFLLLNLCVINFGGWKSELMIRAVRKIFYVLSKFAWSLETKSALFGPSKYFSPYINCVSIKRLVN
jgi:2-polyprenyl-3-methyl-5-hydroxy-6-metoxy-1,4-benzoquinol methylase